MKKESFSGKWGFILSAAGSAVGLGNIWRFPYLCGQYGGLSFILLYLFILLFICNPLMVAEIAIGRTAKSNCLDAYRIIGHRCGLKNLSLWAWLGGGTATIGAFLCMSFYPLVASWVLYYFLETVSGKLFLISQDSLTAEFDMLTQNFTAQYCCGWFFLFVTALIVIAGVQKGLEKTNLYLMPMLFVIFILLSVRSITLDNGMKGVDFLLTLDLQYWGFTEEGFKITRLFDTFIAALGQAFLSLSLGFGFLMVYGSYFSNKENLFQATRRIEVFDTMAAILSTTIIIPAIFAAGLPTTSGPGLTFISLPLVFQQISCGPVWAFLFYLLLMIATITSLISGMEMLTNLVMAKLSFKRFAAVVWVLIGLGTGFTFVAASFSGMWDIKVWGRDLFTLFDWLASTYTATVVSLVMSLFVGYFAMKPIILNIRRSAFVSLTFTRYFLITLRYVSPAGLGLLLVMSLLK